jgi:TolB protein
MDFRNNGEEVIVSARIGNAFRYQLFIINTVTGAYRQVTSDTAAMHSDPAFSPDGKKIAFCYRKDKRDRSQHEELYLMNADGTGLQRLTHYPENDISKNEPGYKAGATRWHPTKNFISYISMQGGRHQIFTITPDGKTQVRLTNNDFSEGWHDWSPDGKWLVFDKTDGAQYHIVLMNFETKAMTQLTDTTYKYQQSPVFVQVR